MIPQRGPSLLRKPSSRYSLLIFAFISASAAFGENRPDSLHSSEPIIRISLTDNVREFTLAVHGRFSLKYQYFTIAEISDTAMSFTFSPNGVAVATLPNQKLRFSFPMKLEPADSSRGQLKNGIRYSNQSGSAKSGQTFPGSLEIFPQKDGTFQIINLVPLETYLRGVVPNELVNNLTPDEFQACMAQAIAARNFAFFKMDKQDSANFDVYSDTRDQVYSGVERYKSIADSAINLTSGMIVEYHGQPARCFFHSACGGHTESVQNIWQGQPALPYLQGVSDMDSATGDPYCIYSQNFFWSRSYPANQINSLVKENLAFANPMYTNRTPPGTITDMRILDRFDSFRVDSLAITAENGDVYYVRGDRARYLFKNSDGTPLRSSLFRITVSRNSQGRLEQVVLKGQGTGHGVGMCQWGSIGMSKLGFSYLQILSHYFPGTEVKKVY
jgi:SpoIID/LytB domain protein